MRVRFGDFLSDAARWAANIGGGLANPSGEAAIAQQEQSMINVQGPPPNYTPIILGGSLVVLLAVFLKRGRWAASAGGGAQAQAVSK